MINPINNNSISNKYSKFDIIQKNLSHAIKNNMTIDEYLEYCNNKWLEDCEKENKQENVNENINEACNNTLEQRVANMDKILKLNSKQREPTHNYKNWLIIAGRGFGKTYAGASTVLKWILQSGYKNVGIIGYSYHEIQNIMLYGPSGIITLLETISPQINVIHQRQKRVITINDRAKIFYISSCAHNNLRGLQFDALWADEMFKFKNVENILNNINCCLRLGEHPKMLITSTPTNSKDLKRLLKQPYTHITRGSTTENNNLSQSFKNSLLHNQSRQSNWYKQEVEGEIVDMQYLQNVEQWHINSMPPPVDFLLLIDPAVANSLQAHESGILLVARDKNNNIYLIEDLSIKGSRWMEVLEVSMPRLKNFKNLKIIIEKNQGGDMMVDMTKRQFPNMEIGGIRVSNKKSARKQNLMDAYRNGQIRHYGPPIKFEAYNKQLTGDSNYDDRLDAMSLALIYTYDTQEGYRHGSIM